MSHPHVVFAAAVLFCCATAQGLAQSARHIKPNTTLIAGEALPTHRAFDLSKLSLPAVGRDDAPVAIVEFSEFECPYCRRHAGNVLPRILEKYIDTGKVRYLFVQMPLPEHPGAERGAIALLCAARLGAALPMYRQLFQLSPLNQTAVAAAVLATGVQGDAFAQCTEHTQVRDELAKHVALSEEWNVIGTPTFLIGALEDHSVVRAVTTFGSQPLAFFESHVERLLKERARLQSRDSRTKLRTPRAGGRVV